ncbi:MAG: cyclic nucleotide-binding domain-containing protein [Rhodocyclales bacterium]|nr:cyclic nucleotide-binding domain-containing protein [Rhodocyclales bacterium]
MQIAQASRVPARRADAAEAPAQVGAGPAPEQDPKAARLGGVPLLSPEIFDFLQQQKIKPYVDHGAMAREQLGDGVRLLSLRAGETFTSEVPRLRINVLSGSVLLKPGNRFLDLAHTRKRVVMTRPGINLLQAVEDCVVVLADSEFLDTLSSWQELTSHARQSGSAVLADRLARVRHSLAFRRLPLEHVEQALSRMTPRHFGPGETILTKGDAGDAFYLIWSGRVGVWRTGLYDEDFQLVAELGPGDTFGDEALVSGGTRNATIKTLEDCEVLLLERDDFNAIMSQPMVEELPPDVVAKMIDTGWKVVDVRYPEEFEDAHIPGAILLPLPDLRREADAALDKNEKYITVCLSGKRSMVAAFLLKQRGFKAASMKDGMGSWCGSTESSY